MAFLLPERAPRILRGVRLQSLLRRRARPLCYESSLRSNPSLKGKVTTRFVIDRSGAFCSASDGGSDLPDRQVVQCVVRGFGFGHLSFPQPEGGVVTVSYPNAFRP